MYILKQIDQLLEKIEGHLIVLILNFMISLSFVQILLRNFFDMEILWGDTLLRQWVLWLGFLGASLAVKHEKHISIEVLTNLSSLYWKRIIKSFTRFSVGINLFIAATRFNKPVFKLYQAVLSFLGLRLVGLILITYVPPISLFWVDWVSR
jgi:TRAP-type C4-dicarboxylate transport system permease small subunit